MYQFGVKFFEPHSQDNYAEVLGKLLKELLSFDCFENGLKKQFYFRYRIKTVVGYGHKFGCYIQIIVQKLRDIYQTCNSKTNKN